MNKVLLGVAVAALFMALGFGTAKAGTLADVAGDGIVVGDIEITQGH